MYRLVSVGIACLFLGGCGVSMFQVRAEATLQSNASLSGVADLKDYGTDGAGAGSWMSSNAAGQDLLYASSCCWVSVYTYPQGKLVGKLTGFAFAAGQCVDGTGSVYIADDGRSRVYKYPHGGKKPSRAFQVPGALDCSIDPTSGNLAVVSWAGAGVWIFRDATGRPTKYKNSNFFGYYSCGYDSKGDLFVDGISRLGSGNVVFAELPKGGNKLKTVVLDQYLAFPAGVKWDGKHVAVGDGTTPAIYQFVVKGRRGTRVGTTHLDSGEWTTHQFWIQGETLLTATQCYHLCEHARSNVAVMFFKYPAGGIATKMITSGFKGAPDGVSVSLAPR